MTHNTLEAYYQTNIGLIKANMFSLTELDNMVPFERDVYIELLRSDQVEQENQKMAAQWAEAKRSQGAM